MTRCKMREDNNAKTISKLDVSAEDEDGDRCTAACRGLKIETEPDEELTEQLIHLRNNCLRWTKMNKVAPPPKNILVSLLSSVNQKDSLVFYTSFTFSDAGWIMEKLREKSVTMAMLFLVPSPLLDVTEDVPYKPYQKGVYGWLKIHIQMGERSENHLLMAREQLLCLFTTFIRSDLPCASCRTAATTKSPLSLLSEQQNPL